MKTIVAIGSSSENGQGAHSELMADAESHYRARGNGEREHLALIMEQRDRVLENRGNMGQRYPSVPQLLKSICTSPLGIPKLSPHRQ